MHVYKTTRQHICDQYQLHNLMPWLVFESMIVVVKFSNKINYQLRLYYRYSIFIFIIS